MAPLHQIVRLLPSMIVGIVFVASAVLKLLSIQEFEIYVYEFGLMPFTATSIAVRLLIVAETVIGLLLIAPWRYTLSHLRINYASWAAIVMLIAFSLYLIVQILRGDTSNCHCMGEAFDLDPTESLIKNAILLTLLAVSHQCKLTDITKRVSVVSILLSLITAVTIFAIIPPDFMRIVKQQKSSQLMLYDYLDANGISRDHTVVCALSFQCHFCRLTARKIDVMAKRSGLSKDHIVLLFRRDHRQTDAECDSLKSRFFEAAHIEPRTVRLVSADTLPIIAPRVPTIFVLEADTVRAVRGYRTLTDDDLAF